MAEKLCELKKSGGSNGGGGSYTSFTPVGTSVQIAGTNFNIGKYYILAISGNNTDTVTPTGATLISRANATNSCAMLVKATASTISVGTYGANGAVPIPLEFTL